MAVLQMQKISICALKKDRKANSFHKSGKYEQSPQQKTAEVHPNFPDNMFLVNLQIQS